jgi:hypothetical protein
MQKVQLGVQLASLAKLNCKSRISELTNRTSKPLTLKEVQSSSMKRHP